MTVREALQQACAQISILDAEVLLAHVLGTTRSGIITEHDNELTTNQQKQFLAYTQKRAANIPVAYLTGYKEFFGLNIAVNEHTLVPRPDTEVLVESTVAVLTALPDEELRKLTLLDIGTGSGAIPIAILAELRKHHRPLPKTYATDISRGALRVARKNALTHAVPVRFFLGNLLEPIKPLLAKQCVITTNLPYLTKAQMIEPSIAAEPRSALVSGVDGLDHYREFFAQFTQYKAEQISYSLFLECDPEQIEQLQEVIEKSLSDKQSTTVFYDLSGHSRGVIVRG